MRHQVVHNRGHGFSKRFIPAGVYNFLPTRANRLLMPVQLVLFLWRPAEGGWLHSIHAQIYP